MAKLKQATLSSLKGVVVVEDFLRHKNVLENAVESKEVVLSTLSYLKKKKPSKEVLEKIGIEPSLKILKNHCDKDIAQEAKNLCEYWELEGNAKVQPTVEVRYDNLTRHIRRNALRLFTEALGGQEDDEKIADKLEKEIFHITKRLISKNYRKTVRKVVFKLRHNENEKIALKTNKMTQVEFVKRIVQ
ncbi:transcription elongation factor A N-terminal and central domain-containing protein 2 [Parasteatoda tepidariorum]|uniref:transcription elongation factor A N-terminal and central domain-containing protein 2 n=1 Tax=Parasteatoda tepidariorum TaxID=114398 RepID=UPI00077FD3B9|nr:transcription elongation factor A N-terminal and central domain-containing protein 2 [Parasteatoda tepidariorum]XP_015930512.1 transcription elongation factor A N-terminal and central domain-containing protein 2 [Parasteatoda tepidariorum]